MSLGCATLQWLLTENAAADIVKAQALSSVQGVAPDGTDVHLIIREVSRVQLSCPGGHVGLDSSSSEWGPWATQEESDSGAHLPEESDAPTSERQAMMGRPS